MAESTLDASATAQAALRHFARVTNLVLASSAVGLAGTGPIIDQLDRILSVIGAQSRRVPPPVPAEIDLLILAGFAGTPLLPADLAAGPAPLIILDLDGTGVDHAAFARLPAIPARPGLTGWHAERDVFLLDPVRPAGGPR